MTDEATTEKNEPEAEGPEGEGHAEAGSRSRRDRMSDGIRQGIGVLSAFKDALEETIQEARDRGDLSTDRAKEVMKEALERAQSAAEEAKGKLDFAHHAEVEETRTEMETLKASFEALRQRVQALEESVFGEGGGKGDAS
ncbi:MAG: hypothetical protein R3253_11780 [Longimicrobiales bacterium]|nr:hypothetical protein [Longimicrobiales bacterium]